MSKALKTYAAFKEPSPYDRERQKAEQLRRYAELLQEQSLAQDEPFTYQGFRAMPSPAAALGKMLQAYGARKTKEKAAEAEEQARLADIEGFEALRKDLGPQEQVAPPDMFGDPMEMGSKYTPPTMQTVMPTFQQQQDRLTQAMATGTPAAQRYAQLMLARQPQVSIDALMEASPESREQYRTTGDPMVLAKPTKSAEVKPPVFTGGKYYDTESQTWKDIPGYVEQQREINAATRAPEPLMLVDVNGVPTYTPRSKAVGQRAFVNKPSTGLTGEDKVDRRKHREKRQELQNAYNSVLGFVQELKNTPKEESLFGEKAGRLASKYKLALGAVRVLQNTGVLNVGEMPFIEDTLRDPQSISQLFNPSSRAAIGGQIDSILDLLEGQSSVNDELYGYDVTPLKGRELRGEKIPAAAVKAGLTQADWDAATEEEKAAWR